MTRGCAPPDGTPPCVLGSVRLRGSLALFFSFLPFWFLCSLCFPVVSSSHLFLPFISSSFLFFRRDFERQPHAFLSFPFLSFVFPVAYLFRSLSPLCFLPFRISSFLCFRFPTSRRRDGLSRGLSTAARGSSRPKPHDGDDDLARPTRHRAIWKRHAPHHHGGNGNGGGGGGTTTTKPKRSRLGGEEWCAARNAPRRRRAAARARGSSGRPSAAATPGAAVSSFGVVQRRGLEMRHTVLPNLVARDAEADRAERREVLGPDVRDAVRARDRHAEPRAAPRLSIARARGGAREGERERGRRSATARKGARRRAKERERARRRGKERKGKGREGEGRRRPRRETDRPARAAGALSEVACVATSFRARGIIRVRSSSRRGERGAHAYVCLGGAHLTSERGACVR